MWCLAGSCLIVCVAFTLWPVDDLVASVSFAQRWSSRDVLWHVDELVANTASLSQLWPLRDKFVSRPAIPLASVNSVFDHSSSPDSHGLRCRYPPPAEDPPPARVRPCGNFSRFLSSEQSGSLAMLKCTPLPFLRKTSSWMRTRLWCLCLAARGKHNDVVV